MIPATTLEPTAHSRPSAAPRERGSRKPRAETVPAVAGDVDEHCDSAVRFVARFRDELHATIEHPLSSALEVVDTQEQADPPCELVAEGRNLPNAAGLDQ